MELDMPKAVDEITRGLAYLKSQGNPGRKFGVIGFCMGGGLALRTAINSSDVDAVAVFYGRNPDPIDQVQNISAPLLGVYGDQDQGIPVSEVGRLQEALNQHGKQNEIHVYEGAGHAFFNDTHGTYKADAASDAWGKTIDFFTRNLKG
jgi:carboxymethylenebutenolidase